MRVLILQTALDDLAAGHAFYERQEPGLGSKFLESLFADIDSLSVNAGIHRVHFGFHRLLAKRYPYAAYYRTAGNEVVVYRVLDCRRNPHSIRTQLGKEG